ncbi:LysR family transcriptional regulator [Castellaniella caeni]|uniref:LysR family transcriptional regulator n=1 Tax=Castellaniella caeni TaxID=266123 RepID=UPI000833D0DD|nr:LysR substrate-binding domain-containing protein [Castellaniella caeni]
MRLRHIEIFEAIRQAGSLTQAAALLNISQPAASKILAHAEAQLGFKLFERVKGRLIPTREAEILTPQIIQLGQDLAHVRRLAANLRQGRQGHLRIGCAPAIGLGLLPMAIRRFHPGSQASFKISTLHSPGLVAGLHAQELDLIVTFDGQDHPGLRRIPVGATELAYLSRTPTPSPVALKTLADRPVIALDTRDQVGTVMDQTLRQAGITLDTQIIVQTHYVACSLVEAGCGDAIVDLLTGHAMLKPGMALCRLDPAIPIPIYVMAHAADPLSLLHHKFIDCLRTACQQLA